MSIEHQWSRVHSKIKDTIRGKVWRMSETIKLGINCWSNSSQKLPHGPWQHCSWVCGHMGIFRVQGKHLSHNYVAQGFTYSTIHRDRTRFTYTNGNVSSTICIFRHPFTHWLEQEKTYNRPNLLDLLTCIQTLKLISPSLVMLFNIIKIHWTVRDCQLS